MEASKICREVAKISPAVIVAYSGGKDSLAVLDICFENFKTVKAFAMYFVKGLSCFERMIHYAEKRYNIEIKQYPHFIISRYIKGGLYMPKNRATKETKLIKITDIINKAREDFQIDWVAFGYKRCDSLERRGMMALWEYNHSIDYKRRIFSPIANLTNKAVNNYLRFKNIPEPENFGRAKMSGIDFDTIPLIKEKYPADYAKIKKIFPFVDISIKRRKALNENKISKI